MTGDDHPLLMSVRQEQGTVFLTLSNGEVFELAPDSVPDQLPQVGEGFDPFLLREIQMAAERKKIARRLFALLDRRLSPVAKLRKKLLEEGFIPEGIDAVLEQMSARGLYSDRTFAEAWCRDFLLNRAVGKNYMIAKLRGKKVPGPVAAAAAEAVLDPEREAELAHVAATRKWGRNPGRPDRKAEARVIRFLQGRGFAIGLAVKAMRDTRPDPSGECEEEV